MRLKSIWLALGVSLFAPILFAQQMPLSLQQQMQQLYSIYDHALESGNPLSFFAKIMAPDYVCIEADGSQKGGRQKLDELAQTLRSLPRDAEVHIATTLQKVTPNNDGSVEVHGSSHLEITSGGPGGSINGLVRDILFDHMWIRTPRGLRLRVERVVSEKQSSRTLPGR